MFKKNKPISEEFSGYLSDGTSVNGDLQFSGKLHLNGNFHGSISTTDVLIIGEKAIVEADIKAGEIQVCGKVIGNIECARSVEITESGQVRGDVRAPQFIINVGGVFEGKSSCHTSIEKNSGSVESLSEPDRSTDEVDQPSTY